MADEVRMLPQSLADILAVLAPGWAVPGSQDHLVDSVCIDSRQALPGSLFVALPGEQVDGHDYVGAAFAAGARLALVERSMPGFTCLDTLTRTAPADIRTPAILRVQNTLGALQALAAVRRRSYPQLRVVGITGSVGKTTVKEVVAHVLGAKHAVLKSSGNRNNEIGLPLTLMQARPEHRYAVLEMGMYQLGEIDTLCQIADPQIGLVTNVEPVHLERLGSIERIAQAKAELVRALPGHGYAVLNADDARVAAMGRLTGAGVVTFGQSPGAAVRAVDIESRGLDGSAFTAQAEASRFPHLHAACWRLRTAMLGPHAVQAALAGVAVGLSEGLSWEQIEQGLDALGQGLRLVTRHGRDGITILDDCYNASPSSVSAALQLLGTVGARRVAVLGDMLELGGLEAAGHEGVGRVAAASSDLLLTVGVRARGIAAAARTSGMHAVASVDDNTAAIRQLKGLLRPGDVVLVKGSRSMQMERIVTALQEGDQ